MPKLKYLLCSCCGDSCIGQQWHNRDKGFGLCPGCAVSLQRSTPAEDMKSAYGVAGVHYYMPATPQETAQ